jgi:HD-GYP domain-containing protein (c-di-GMP phosphodiesterase class II)
LARSIGASRHALARLDRLGAPIMISRAPWTRDLLRNIPDIARAHHEKLNGSGYPEGIQGGSIAIESRMMTITDIFDALTARDRPYKAAVPVDKALDILGFERKAGAIDGDLLDLSIAVKPWERLES